MLRYCRVVVHRMRRSLTGPVVLAMIGLVLFPIDSDIAANALPDAWKSHLWLTWPMGAILATPMIFAEIRERHRPREYGSDTVEEQQRQQGRAAHDLAQAVWRQWTKEAGSRSLHSPEPIRVRWSSVGRPAAADLWKVFDTGAAAGRPVRLRGDMRQVIDVFRRISARQLVILGEPAAGKSVLALLLTLGLLPDEPVPVLLTVSSWDPHQEDLHSWVARRIVEEYPALANSTVYGPDAAVRLVVDRRVMPVLDGLDEMSVVLRPAAINAIDRAVGDRCPLVVTCRTAEYHDAVNRNGRFLAHAAVLEIQPVDIDDAANFLTGADPHPERWRPVLDHLYAEPDGPLARALRTPLMVDLTRTVYATSAGDPGELVDLGRFPDQRDVERHLFDAFLCVAYQNRPAPPGSRPGSVLVQYPSERPSQWLRFLAGHHETLGGQDLAWWRLEHTVSRLTRAVLVGLITGLMFGLTEGSVLGPTYGLAYAVTFGLTAGVALGFGHTHEPSRIEVRFRENGESLLRRFVAGLAIGSALTPVVGLVNGIVAVVVFTVALTAHLWLDAPPDTATAASPMSVLTRDRGAALTLSLVLAVAFGPITGIATGPAGGHDGVAAGLISVLASAGVGVITGGFVYGRAGAVAFGIAGAGTGWLRFVNHSESTIFTLLASDTAFGVIIGGLGLLSRAWGAFAFARLWLALRGHLPLRLMRFLDDAHQRGVLRRSGTVYQFRHERLHDHIATPSDRVSQIHGFTFSRRPRFRFLGSLLRVIKWW